VISQNFYLKKIIINFFISEDFKTARTKTIVVLLRLNPVFKPKAGTDSYLFEFHPQFGGFCITAAGS
jgi:hypothetical protein